jgi:hypothetical protein
MLTVVMMNVVMMNVDMLSVFMLSVMAPLRQLFLQILKKGITTFRRMTLCRTTFGGTVCTVVISTSSM